MQGELNDTIVHSRYESEYMHCYILRGTETEEQILKRLQNAKAEIVQGESSGIFDHFLYNDNLEECYKNLKVIPHEME